MAPNTVAIKIRDAYTEDLASDLDPRHRRIAEVYMLEGTFNIKKTAAIIGCHETTVRDAVVLPHVKKYIDELLDRQGFKLKAIRNRILKELVACATGNIAEVEFIEDEHGTSVKSLAQLPLRVQRAIRRLKVTTVTTKDGDLKKTIEVEMHGKETSAQILGKWLGLEIEGRKEAEESKQPERLQLTGVNLIGPPEEKKPDEWGGF